MRKFIVILFACAVTIAVGAQAKEIRVLLANHPYGDLLKAAIPEFEASSGIKVNL
jgi:multiple sugar transport system substrate-binding protein